MTLSLKKIERLRDRGRYRDAHGLYLQVTEAGVRSWVFRYELNKTATMDGPRSDSTPSI